MVLLEMGNWFDYIYFEGVDEALVEAFQETIEQAAEVALFLYGIWYAFPLFLKAVLTQIGLCMVKWESLGQYLTVGYIVGALFSLKPLLLNTSETIEQVSETESDIMFTAFALDGPALAATLFIVWYFSYEKVSRDLKL